MIALLKNSQYEQHFRLLSLTERCVKAIPKDLDVLGCDTPSTGAKWVESSSPAPARILPSRIYSSFRLQFLLQQALTSIILFICHDSNGDAVCLDVWTRISLSSQYGRQDRKLQRYGTPALLFKAQAGLPSLSVAIHDQDRSLPASSTQRSMRPWEPQLHLKLTSLYLTATGSWRLDILREVKPLDI
ncbi:hypothetical protein KC347_g227 [Hortaea werneckii]|nr:hypothetical protein KC347_g227 [Hortaea werneckii]